MAGWLEQTGEPMGGRAGWRAGGGLADWRADKRYGGLVNQIEGESVERLAGGHVR